MREAKMMDRRQFTKAGSCALAMGLALPAAWSLLGCAVNVSAPSQNDTAGALCDDDVTPLKKTFFAFDTVIELSVYGTQELLDRCEQRCEFFESIFSRTREGSDIFLLNQAAGQPVEVHPETADIIEQALVFCEASDGLFDITIGAATELWDFKEAIVPDAAELAKAVTHIDYHTVIVDGCTVTLSDPQAKLDLGGIAKGYIADDLASLLVTAGCTSAFINLGGNVLALGSKPNNKPWNVGIQDPNEVTGAIIAKVATTNRSVVTSGLYERNFEKDGTLYYHILDPATGYPVKTNLESSSILSEKAITGDATSTIAFLLGARAALDYIEQRPELEALLVDETGNIILSDGAPFELL